MRAVVNYVGSFFGRTPIVDESTALLCAGVDPEFERLFDTMVARLRIEPDDLWWAGPARAISVAEAAEYAMLSTVFDRATGPITIAFADNEYDSYNTSLRYDGDLGVSYEFWPQSRYLTRAAVYAEYLRLSSIHICSVSCEIVSNIEQEIKEELRRRAEVLRAGLRTLLKPYLPYKSD